MTDQLLDFYPWIKSVHIMAVISWMAGLFYLPRLFVYHVETSPLSSQQAQIFLTMEKKLHKVIMTPAMFVTWFFGLLMVFTPGIVDFSQIWVWVKLTSVLAMTVFHFWLKARIFAFEREINNLSGRAYRLANEIPTVLMIAIVIAVVVKF